MHNKLIVGQTPLLPLDIDGVKIWGKAEFMNPSGSIKDRPMSNILNRAMENNLLKMGDFFLMFVIWKMNMSILDKWLTTKVILLKNLFD